MFHGHPDTHTAPSGRPSRRVGARRRLRSRQPAAVARLADVDRDAAVPPDGQRPLEHQRLAVRGPPAARRGSSPPGPGAPRPPGSYASRTGAGVGVGALSPPTPRPMTTAPVATATTLSGNGISSFH